MIMQRDTTRSSGFTLDELAKALGGKKVGVSSWMLHCPAHDDKTPSLSATEKNSKILFKCFAECSSKKIVKALSNRGISFLNPKASIRQVERSFRTRKHGKVSEALQRRKLRKWFKKLLRESRISIARKYCVRKGIHPVNIRFANNQLLIPMNNEFGELVGIQRIGWKRGDYDSKFRRGRSIP